MSAPGWYPDPGGQPGMYRFWDGQTWSAALSPTPDAARPASAGAPLGQAPEEPAGPVDERPPATGGKAWIVAGAAILIVLVVVVGFIVRGVSGGVGLVGGDDPTARSTRPVCPRQGFETPDAAATRDGRVYGGKLSYPQLSAPWSPPQQESRVPFGRNAWTQSIHVEDYAPGSSWVASVLVAELNAGDGFYSPQDGSEIVVTCIVGAFYGDAKVTRKDRVNKAVKVDGHEAWLVETDLSFRIPNLQTDGELAIVLIVETGPGTASIYYASIPNTTPQWEAPARQAMADLRVD